MQNDPVAVRTVNSAVSEAVKLVAAVAKALDFDGPYPLAVAGGVVCGNPYFCDALMKGLADLQPPHAEVTLVDEPVTGCLVIARQKLMATESETE